MLNSKLTYLPNRPIILDNETCVYCSVQLDPTSVTKEHVIGRRFVPKGKLNGEWNLIVRACKRCNGKKSDLEDDISAISMQADAWERHSISDNSLAEEAVRKAHNSISRRTRKSVKESSEQVEVRGSFGPGVEFTFNFTSPPQVESERIYKLARMQLMALFYWITFNHKTKRGRFWRGAFSPVLEAICSDWGNPVHKAFMAAVVTWEPRVIAIGADGFFKAIIRRHPAAVCWSWALEWNHKYRIVGFFGEHKVAQQIVGAFPSIEVTTITQGPDKYLRYRIETPLAEEDDTLFLLDKENNTNGE